MGRGRYEGSIMDRQTDHDLDALCSTVARGHTPVQDGFKDNEQCLFIDLRMAACAGGTVTPLTHLRILAERFLVGVRTSMQYHPHDRMKSEVCTILQQLLGMFPFTCTCFILFRPRPHVNDTANCSVLNSSRARTRR